MGKTTATLNIGAAMALRGAHVLLVDTDIGLRNLDVVMGLEEKVVYDLVDVVEGKVPPAAGVGPKIRAFRQAAFAARRADAGQRRGYRRADGRADFGFDAECRLCADRLPGGD